MKEAVRTCTKCGLSQTRTNAVFGEGDPRADVMFVGEGPGKDEDEQGRPFVGAAGRVLTKMLDEIGIARDQVFIGNIIKCRPPNNRDPRPDEIEVCKPYLFAQVAQIEPKVICTLGRHSLHTLVRPDISISREHGKPIMWEGMRYLPMYHPAASLYRGQIMDYLRYDFQQLREMIDRGF